MTPMRATIVGPPDVETTIKAFIAACHSWASCSAFGSFVIFPASSRVTSWRPNGPAAVCLRDDKLLTPTAVVLAPAIIPIACRPQGQHNGHVPGIEPRAANLWRTAHRNLDLERS
jgi:hypothetical protein